MARRVVTAALCMAISLTLPGVAAADPRQDLEEVRQKIAELQSEVATARGERTEVANRILDAATELDRLLFEVDEATQRHREAIAAVTEVEAKIADLETEVDTRSGRIASLSRQIEQSKDVAGRRLAEIYMQGEVKTGVDAFGLADLSALGISSEYAGRLDARLNEDLDNVVAARQVQRREVKALLDARIDLDKAQAQLVQVRERNRLALVEVDAARLAAERALSEQQQLLAALDEEIEHFEADIVALDREEAGIREIIRQEAAAAAAAAESALPAVSPQGYVRPLPGAVSSGYGYRTHPITGDRRLHTGWDLNGSCGEAIKAARSGRVIFADWKGGYGMATMVDHGGGIVTLYAHQSRWAASYGASVDAGEVIGYVGNTGQSTGCHLHYEIRLNGTPVDPAPYH